IPESLQTEDLAGGMLSAKLEDHLAAAQQITHIGSWEWALATNGVSWSDELYRIYGLEPQSCPITFDFFLSKLHPEDRAHIQAEVRQALEAGGRFSYLERIIRPDGSVRVLDTVGEVVKNASGAVSGLIGTCRDVTEERRRDRIIQLYATMAEHAQIGLSVWRADDGSEQASPCLLAFNPALEQAAGNSLAVSVGKPATEVFAGPSSQSLSGALTRAATERSVQELPALRFAESESSNRTFSAKAIPLSGRLVGLVIEDVTVEARARQLQAAEQRILEMTASGVSLDATLEALVLAIEELAPPTIASILLLDAEGVHVHYGAAPHLPSTYNRAIDGRPIGPAAGSCGTAAFLRKPVVVRDIENDPLWDDYRELALAHGLRACWSVPILSREQRVLGTFALYYRAPRSPEPEDLKLIERATHLARIAIQRKELDDQLRALSARMEAAREDERSSIAREIHDELGQALTALKMDLAWTARRLDTKELDRASILERLRGMAQMTDEMVDQVRRISSQLRPGVLDDLGLVAAIEWQAVEFERRTGTSCVVRADLGETRLGREVSTQLFRIFQEALTNVARHADAERVDVRLEAHDERLLLDVRDDGRGITEESASSHTALGLLGIRERARRVGGTATIGGAPGSGTVVSVELPIIPPQGAS
ncbi:MAG TPA: GAF domain-containing protein, partial [Polyangiaceae bacterium]|nr:GAF domain-containing protein [Polyangiaceae bacterium]